MTTLIVDQLSVSFKKKSILTDVSFRVHDCEKLAIIGPNGCGKTTLLKTILGYLKPSSGHVTLDDQKTIALTSTQRSRNMAWIPQHMMSDLDFTVERFLTIGGFASEDQQETLISRFHLNHLRYKKCSEISGGEKQRLMIAHALTQNPKILLLDEVTNHLDIQHQHEILKYLTDESRISIFVLHDLNLALRYCSRVLLIRQGRLEADGPPSEVLTPERVFDSFGINTERLLDSSGRHCLVH